MATEPKFAVRWPLGECRASSAKKTPAPHQTAALAKMSDWYRLPAESRFLSPAVPEVR